MENVAMAIHTVHWRFSKMKGFYLAMKQKGTVISAPAKNNRLQILLIRYGVSRPITKLVLSA